jgi:DNA-directed RNA polymerase subunit RPC12/RpoP
MATTIAVSCPECDKQIKVPAQVQGKKIRCKACGHTFVVKASSADKTAPDQRAGKTTRPDAADEVQVLPLEEDEILPVQQDKDALDQVKAVPARKPKVPAKKKAKDDDDEDANPYDVTDTDLRTRCPHCAGELEEGQVVCLECGYNTVTRERVTKVVKTIEHDFWDWFLWLLPGGICAFVVLALLTWDILYCLLAERWFDKETWYGWLLCHYGIKIWMVIISLFFMWYTGKFAVKRLILNYRPPEKFKS